MLFIGQKTKKIQIFNNPNFSMIQILERKGNWFYQLRLPISAGTQIVQTARPSTLILVTCYLLHVPSWSESLVEVEPTNHLLHFPSF
jgi:hypothetical protein